MISTAAAAGIATVAFTIVITPGPNMMYLVSRSLDQRRPAGLISLCGVATGFVVYVMTTSAGLAALFATVPTLFVVVKLGGAAYLLWLAVNTVRSGQGITTGNPGGAQPAGSTQWGWRPVFSIPRSPCCTSRSYRSSFSPLGGSVWAQTVELGLVQVVVATAVNA